jgi:flavin reductase (DIM6/NTAB) family NADH-FMN oxidoreductase RutF
MPVDKSPSSRPSLPINVSHPLPRNTVTNAEASGVFCWNLATYSLREAVNLTASFSPDSLDEFAAANLSKLPASLIDCPMVADSPIRFECRYHTTLRLPGNPPMGSVDVVIGKVVGIHIDEGVLTEGKVDLGKVMPIARCGYYEYAVIRGDAVFEMVVPGGKEMLVGLVSGFSGGTRLARCEPVLTLI